VSVLLAIDVSQSMEGPGLDQAKIASLELLDILPDSASVGIVSFASSAVLVSAPTTDRAETAEAIESLEAGGATVLYDATVLAAETLAGSAADRRAVILLTDGDDTESVQDVDDVADAMGGIDSFYVISLQTERADTAVVEELADAGDGRLVEAADPEALTATYLDLGQRIVNQYEITFTSTTPERVGRYEIGVAGEELTGSLELALPNRPATTDPGPAERALPGALTGTVEPHALQQSWVLWLGAALIALAIGVAAFFTVPSLVESRTAGPRPPRQRRLGRRSLQSDAVVTDERSGAEHALESMRDAATGVATRAIERTGSTNRIDAALDRAGLVMRAGEYVALVIAVAIGAAIVGYLLFGVVIAAVGLLVPLLGAKAFLDFKASRRNAKFADQLSDALMIMAGSLRSGFGVGQAIDTVAEEMDDPLGSEFRRAILETRLGRDIEDALDGVAKRVQNEDFEWVIDAMRINRQVGGDLAQILDQVGETIRARNRLKRQVAALTAEGRISAMVLGFLPIGMALVLYTSNPDYMDPLFSRTIGWIMLGVAVGLLITGALWLKKMIDIEY
jgi:tight adherence protein B